MPIRYIRNDITKIEADAIVNTANPKARIGGGTDSAIYEAAGRERLLKAREKIGYIQPGEAVITSGFDLCNYIIHTVGPKFIDGQHGEAEQLRSCYRNSLDIAKANQCKSIVFPLISTGIYGFPKEDGIRIAVTEISSWLLNTGNMDVTIAVFDDASYAICLKLSESITSFIDSAAARSVLEKEYGVEISVVNERAKQASRFRSSIVSAPAHTSFSLSKDERTFASMLKHYIDESHLTPKEIYTEAGIDKRLFSKVQKEDYHVGHDTAIFLCFALKLTLEQSADLLARAGYAFSPSASEDRIYAECLRKHLPLKEARKLIAAK